jgi:hypothetical protein
MCSIASNALKAKYPITVDHIVDLCRDIDRDNGSWYKHRNFHAEAKNALEFAYSKT